MTTTTLESLRQRRDELLAIATSCGASDLRVFGSVARGDDTGNSDVDSLIRMQQGRSLLDLATLRDKLQTAIARPVDVVSENGIYPYLRQHILNEAVPL
ncbi:MAG TPA: nucleotidyltransferase family protein [Rhodanobacter sp.]|nr:nucleotidyltransferase family protein [Rhodanobacter sp.]